MATTEVETAQDRHGHGRRRRWSTGLVWVLLLAHLVAVAAVIVTGQRSSSLGELTERVASGDVVAITVRGGLGPGSTGSALVEVSWRDGLLERVTEVTERRSRPDRSTAVERLVAQQPGLEVTRAGQESGWSAAVLGLRVHGPLALALLSLVVADLLLVALGPEPLRATRWAWAWLLLSPAGLVVGVALLLLGGHLRLVPPPAPRSRGLTGGWAFLLFLILGAGLGADL